MALPNVDPAWTAGGIVAAFGALAVPLWRTWLAKQQEATTTAQGGTTWIQQQAAELASSRKIIDELLALRRTDAELIAALKLDKALYVEREERMTRRLARLEEIIIDINPDFEKWIRSDFGPLPPSTKGRLK